MSEPCQRLTVVTALRHDLAGARIIEIDRCNAVPTEWLPAKAGTDAAMRFEGAWFCAHHTVEIQRERESGA